MRIREPVVRQAAAACREMTGGIVLCAVSGGRDSMVLLHALRQLEGVRIAAAHFNHQLRENAGRDERFVQEQCKEWDVPLVCGSGDVRAYAAENGGGVEDAARTLRYRFLESAASQMGAEWIATAHHRDDNAETILLNLLRGAGLRGMCGIPPVRGRIVRPLLGISRDEIDSYAAKYGIMYVEDETNRDTAYTRNRIRLEVLPLLEEIFPGCTGRIAAAGGLLREEEAHMQAEADKLLPAAVNGKIVLPVPALKRQDLAMQRRLVRTMGRRLGITPEKEQVDAVLSLGSGGMVSLTGEVCAVRMPHQLVLCKNEPLPPPLLLQSGGQVWGPWRVTLREMPEPVECGTDSVVLDAAVGPLTAAPWDGSGRLAVENGSRTLKRLFMDCGIPPMRRQEHPVLYAGGVPVAAVGVGVDWKFLPETGRPCVCVTFTPIDGEKNKGVGL